MMFARRRATADELEQGQQEMLAAQQRLEEERATATEQPMEDAKGPEVAESFESPRTTQRVNVQGREEMPKSSSKSLAPPVPAEDETKVTPADDKEHQFKRPVSEVKAEARTPASAAGPSPEAQTALVPID